MRLADMEPTLHGTVEDGVLRFLCPHPGCDHSVRVNISAAPFHERAPREEGRTKPEKVWQASGEFPDTLTLQPSIDIIEADEQGNKIRTLCWHGFVTNGDVR